MSEFLDLEMEQPDQPVFGPTWDTQPWENVSASTASAVDSNVVMQQNGFGAGKLEIVCEEACVSDQPTRTNTLDNFFNQLQLAETIQDNLNLIVGGTQLTTALVTGSPLGIVSAVNKINE